MASTRRDFIKTTMLGAGSSMMLGGLPLRAFGVNKKTSNTTKKLVIIQLHGGNDVLNFFPPSVGTPQREVYVYKRPRISLPASGRRSTLSLGLEDDFSLHPDMIGLKQLWDQGKVALVPNVGTDINNGSHFRGRDIRAMGGGFNDYYGSGWVARFLEHKLGSAIDNYPDEFPSDTYPDPLSLELGVLSPSLPFHFSDKLPASIAVSSPSAFNSLVNGDDLDAPDGSGGLEGINDNEQETTIGMGKIGYPPASLVDTGYYSQMDWLINLERDADKYSFRIKEVYEAGGGDDRQANYPVKYPFAPTNGGTNPLSQNLKNIVTLINGGIDTQVFLVRMGGFDTHADQVESYDSSLGDHASKAYHLSQALAAFQEDLAAIGREEDVITITTSEFSRQIADNGFGTDHGWATYDLVVGKAINGGVVKENDGTSLAPTEEELLNSRDLKYKTDYRRVYTTLLKHWFDVDDADIPSIIDPNYGSITAQEDSANWEGAAKYLSFLGNVSTDSTRIKQSLFHAIQLAAPYPNPATDMASLELNVPYQAAFTLKLYNQKGKFIKTFFNEKELQEGLQVIALELTDIKAGQYFISLSAEGMSKTTKLLKI